MFKDAVAAQSIKNVFLAPVSNTVRHVVMAAGFTVALIYAVTIIQENVLKVYQNTSGSMEPSVYPGQFLLGSRLGSSIKNVKHGDIEVVRFPESFGIDAGDRRLLKRVVAVEGDTVEIKGGTLYLNGEPLLERYTKAPMAYDMPSIMIRENHVFLMGDNRNRSRDSSVFGPLHERWIEAKVKSIFSS